MFNAWQKEWDGFTEGRWSTTSVNVRDFIKKNYTPYEGDESFLAPPTEATKKLWDKVMDLSRQEREAGGVLDMDTKIIPVMIFIICGFNHSIADTFYMFMAGTFPIDMPYILTVAAGNAIGGMMMPLVKKITSS